MATAKKAAPKKSAPKAAASKAPAVEGDKRGDIKMTFMIETVDGKVHEDAISIKNPRGCIRPDMVNSIDHLMSTLKNALISKLGRNHVQ